MTCGNECDILDWFAYFYVKIIVKRMLYHVGMFIFFYQLLSYAENRQTGTKELLEYGKSSLRCSAMPANVQGLILLNGFIVM